jgi:hypothetical protein
MATTIRTKSTLSAERFDGERFPGVLEQSKADYCMIRQNSKNVLMLERMGVHKGDWVAVDSAGRVRIIESDDFLGNWEVIQ